MNAALSADLLERTHDFPCTFTFKVIGKVDNGFSARVIAAIREALHAEADPPFRVREAAGGRHISVTVEPLVQTAEQVLAVYRRIALIAGLVLVF
jgi:putative lipoic acid-binding regulatory protein